MIKSTHTIYDPKDPEIVINSPFPTSGSVPNRIDMAISQFVERLVNAARLETPSQRWEKLKQLIIPNLLCLGCEKGQLIMSIVQETWDSHICKEEDQDWPNKVEAGKTYEYLYAYTPEVTYFKIRKGLQGRVGEFLELKKGPLLKGKEALKLGMHIVNYLKMDVVLNDDALIDGLIARIFLPIVSPRPKNLYSEVGFVLWLNHPTFGYDGVKLAVQDLNAYNAAIAHLKSVKLAELGRIEMASRKQVNQISDLCLSYEIEFKRSTVHGLGAAIFRAMKIPERNVQATEDFRTYHNICLQATDSKLPEAEAYNRSLDVLFQFKFWIKRYQ